MVRDNKRRMYFLNFGLAVYKRSDLRELRDVIFNDLLNLSLHLWCDVTSCNLFEQSGLGRRQVLAEFTFPLRDLVHWDGVQLQIHVSCWAYRTRTHVRTRPFTPA